MFIEYPPYQALHRVLEMQGMHKVGLLVAKNEQLRPEAVPSGTREPSESQQADLRKECVFITEKGCCVPPLLFSNKSRDSLLGFRLSSPPLTLMYRCHL